MKTQNILLLLILPSILLSQNRDDGWDHRIIYQYDTAVEVARASIRFLPDFSTQGHATFSAWINPDLPLNGGTAVTDGEFNMNYIRTFTPLGNNATSSVPEHSDLDYDLWSENIVYFDGLGRESQQVAVRGSSLSSDVIQPIVYDDFGRQKKEYLPYAITQAGNNGPGGYRTNALTEQLNFYDFLYPDEQGITYTDKEFDNSPLNLIMKQSSPGYEWRMGGGHTIELEYCTNSSNEVCLFSVTNTNQLKWEYYYMVGKLSKSVVKDENHNINNNKTIEYKDFSDRVILKAVYDGTGLLKTYYAYDKLGQLRFVLPPESQQYLESATPPQYYGNETEWIKELCFYYEYDYRKRMKTKRLPGSEPVYLVYNNKNQLILTQDGNLRQENKWLFTKYDVFDRPVMTGIYQHGSSTDQETMQTLVNGYTDLWEEVDLQSDHGYTNVAFPDITTTGCEVLTVSYYDNYGFINLPQFNGRYNFDDN
nr:hypothetical protein [Bacteroidota bacterium]